MQLYKNFCKETFNSDNVLTDFSLVYPENYNFGYDVVDEMAKLAPNDKAVVWCDTTGNEKIFTFADISRLSNKTANMFLSHGIKKGDKVLVILKRNYEYWYVAPALHKIGAVIIPATHMLTIEDIVYRIETANITAAVCTPQLGVADKMIKAAEREPKLKNIFVTKGSLDGAIDFDAELEKASDKLLRIPTLADEPMLIYFTSGTTGYPKAVIHDHTYTLSHIITARHWQCVKEGGLHLTVAETGWGKASWGKIYGQWLCGCAVMVYDFDNFSPGALLSIIQKYKVTSFCAPPTIYRYFIKKDMRGYDLSSLEHITTAGEALNPEVFRAVQEQTGLNIMEGFGQTESVLMLASLENTEPHIGSMGKPSPLYDVRILKENGDYADIGEVGEIVVVPKGGKQHGIFIGYCSDDALYKRVWSGGVYHTGDTAYCDKNGYFYYVGRVDDLIKTSGFRVGPFEIENILMEHPAVLECAVTGVPDSKRGQAIKATIVLAEGYTPSSKLQNDIRAFCNAKTSPYKHIQQFEFVSEMPKTISGKIRRTELRRIDIKPFKRRVNYYETDKMNIVHHSNYFRYFEEARLDYMEQIGCDYETLEKLGIIIPITEASAKYISSLHYGEDFYVRLNIAHFNGVTIGFDYIIEQNGRRAAEGNTELCFVNKQFHPISIKRQFPEIYNKFMNMTETNTL